ncbi:MAG: TonB-dependent receptor plug domain-containing protein [Methyloligellaceae bacterium]
MPLISFSSWRRICTALIAATGLAALFSEEARTQEELPGIVIEAAGLLDLEADKVGSAYTVITGEELKAKQIRHAGDALREVAGVSVSRSGGVGNFTQVRLRGAEANHASVRIDGVEVNSLDVGEFDFAGLLTADIERIEVVRGPQSGVYGANALAGVINIITKKGTGAPSATVRSEAGSFGTKSVSANASGGSETAYLSVTAAYFDTDGFNISEEGSEDDGATKKNIFARGGVTVTKNVRVDGMVRYFTTVAEIDEDSDFDGLPDDTVGSRNERDNFLANIALTGDFMDGKWQHKLFANYYEDDFTSISASSGPFVNDGDRVHYGYQTSLKLPKIPALAGNHTIIGLIEQKDETFENSSDFGSVDASRAQTGIVGEMRGEYYERLFLTANLRYDDNEGFENATTYRVAAAYLFPQYATRLHGSYGKGITNPTFFEQFGATASFTGNASLVPEESIGWDIGIEKKFAGERMVVDLTYFNADLTDEISLIFLPDFSSTVINLEGISKRQGIEVQVSLKPTDRVSMTASYTYTDATEPDGTAEIRRPKNTGALNMRYLFAENRGQINVGLIYNGETRDAAFLGSPLLDDYLLVNLSGSYDVSSNVRLFGRIENLLDDDYQEVFGFETAGVAAFGGVKISLGGDTAPTKDAK